MYFRRAPCVTLRSVCIAPRQCLLEMLSVACRVRRAGRSMLLQIGQCANFIEFIFCILAYMLWVLCNMTDSVSKLFSEDPGCGILHVMKAPPPCEWLFAQPSAWPASSGGG